LNQKESSLATQTAPLAGYETTFITKSELTDEALKAFQDRITAIVGNYSGEVVLTEDWGKRKLAYPIHKESRGHYTYLVYTGKGDIVHEIERNLRLSEHVLRFLTVNLEVEFDSEIFKKQRAEYHAAAKRREERRGYDSHDEDRGPRRERSEPSAGPIANAAPEAASDSAE
jgi:small subunit ribosomal protein S6